MPLNKWRKSSNVLLATTLVASVVVPVASAETKYADDLLISEYVEGSSNNKAIEIYNGTGKTVDLSNYSVELYANLNTTPNSTGIQKLTGTLNHGETLVLVHNQAKEDIKKLGIVSSVVNFNGDDTLVLKNGDKVIDSFGKIAIGSMFAENKTFTRNADNLTGDINPNDDIDLTGWTEHPIDTIDNLGKHTASHGVELSEGSVSIADALAAEVNAVVQTEGTLIGYTKNTAHIYDGEKAIAIHPKSVLGEKEVGEYVVVKGKIADFNGLRQISSAELISSKSGSVPTPIKVEAADIGEQYESQLITVENVTIAEDATGTNKAVVGATNFVVRDELSTGVQAGTTYESITGILVEYNGTYQLVPRSAADLKTQAPPVIIETKTIAEARKQESDVVQIQGVITAIIGQTIHIQDETGAIVLYGSLDVAVGDEVVVKGGYTVYRNLLELNNLELVEKKGKKDLPAAKTVTFSELGEDVEAQLVKVEKLKIGEYTNGNYTATDAEGNIFTIRDANNVSGLETGKTYDSITGVVQQYNDIYQIFPRSAADVIEDSTVVQAVSASASGLVTKGSTVTLSTTTAGATIYYTTDGSEPTTESTVYTEPITINENQTIKALAVKEGFTSSKVSTFDYEVFDGSIKIHHIQGESHTSPLKGQTVKGIEGIVTYLFKINNSYYATMQTPDNLADDNPKTSEGILVYIGNSYGTVAVGDHIKVDGVVDEYRVEGNDGDLLSTQINARNGKIDTLAKGVDLPSAVTVTEDTIPRDVIDNDSFAEFDPEEDAIDYWESIEGMRVAFSGLKATAPQEYGDISTVLETRKTDTNNGGILLSATDYNADRIHLKAFKANGNAATDFDVSTGDVFKGEKPIIGVVGYGFSNYKVYVDEVDLKAVYKPSEIQPEKTTIVKDDSKLTVANYNIENFSANTSETSDAKAKLIGDSFVKNMGSPDIIGIVEMQDNDGQTASNSSAAEKSYERLIAAIKAAGGPEYKYVNIDPVYNQDGGAPGANIRPGFLYNPERVQLAEGTPGDNQTAVTYANGKLSHNPGLVNPTHEAFKSSRKPIAAQFVFNGEEVLVVNNHFNSKGGDTALFGGTQPVNLSSEAQRVKIAEQVKSFVESVKQDDKDANVVVLGDLNDFEFSKPLQTLETAGLVNMIKELPREDRYSYTYQGNSQVLDHILVTENLKAHTEVDALHINADYSGVSGKRASDHDPVLVQIDLKKETVTPIQAAKQSSIANAKVEVLTISSPSTKITLGEGVTYERVVVKSAVYAELAGAFALNKVVELNPTAAGAIVNLSGLAFDKVIVKGANVKEIHGAENVKEFVYEGDAKAEAITFRDSKGKLIEVK